MAYTLNHGIDSGGMDRIQRGLLIGLPALALLLGIGALTHNNTATNPSSGSAKVIPVISTLKVDNGSSASKKPNSSAANSAAGAPAAGSSSLQGSSLASSSGSAGAIGSAGSIAGSGGSAGIIGGRGGGPIGGTGSGTGSGGTSGGGVTIPDCSLNQIATVTCQVPACSPAVTLNPGQKAILGLTGTCVVVN